MVILLPEVLNKIIQYRFVRTNDFLTAKKHRRKCQSVKNTDVLLANFPALEMTTPGIP
jgi:hypothetical protein